MFFVYPMALLPVMLAYGARYAFDSNVLFFGLLAFAAALGAVVYWVALDSAVKAARTPTGANHHGAARTSGRWPQNDLGVDRVQTAICLVLSTHFLR